MKVSLIVALALLMTATVTTAQHQHDPIQVKQINGREHPEQIPDEVAYSNFFFGHSAASGQVLTLEQRGALDGAFAVMRLSGADELQLRLAAANFREKFEVLNKSYTIRAEKGAATPRDLWYGVGGIAELVTHTRKEIAGTLSASGFSKYEASVAIMRQHTRFATGGVE
jgi:hypothetical protein